VTRPHTFWMDSCQDDSHFGMFVEKLMKKETWGTEWPPQNLFAVAAHMSSRAGMGNVQVSIVGKGQFTTVVKVVTQHYSVAVKFMNETCTDLDVEFVANELATESRILCCIEMSSSDAKRHIGQYYHSAMLHPLAPILILDAYDNYSELCHLINGKFHHELGFDWLMCVRQVLFHVVITLAQLQREYPQFRHNDLKDNNILCCMLSAQEQVPMHYSFNGAHYVIDMLLIDTKIIDFATAHSAHAELRNPQIVSGAYDAYDITELHCPLYDIHFLIYCFFIRFNRMTDVSSYVSVVLQFFDDIVPRKYFQGKYLNEMHRLTLQGQKELTEDASLQYRCPADLLTHPFFAPFLPRTPEPMEPMDIDGMIQDMIADML
jgi:hypothetical protein